MEDAVPAPPAVLHLWDAPSSRGTSTYRVELLADGTMTCECPGFTYCKTEPKVCRHVRERVREALEIAGAGRSEK